MGMAPAAGAFATTNSLVEILIFLQCTPYCSDILGSTDLTSSITLRSTPLGVEGQSRHEQGKDHSVMIRLQGQGSFNCSG